MENTQNQSTEALDEALELTFPASDPIAVPTRRELVRKLPFGSVDR